MKHETLDPVSNPATGNTVNSTIAVNPAASAPVVSEHIPPTALDLAIDKAAKPGVKRVLSNLRADLANNRRVSHLKLAPKLLASGASDAEVLTAFTASFNSRGVTLASFIEERRDIYLTIARRARDKARKAAKASKAS